MRASAQADSVDRAVSEGRPVDARDVEKQMEQAAIQWSLVHSDLFRPLWDEFDEDKSGTLSFEECLKMTDLVLQTYAEVVPELVEAQFEANQGRVKELLQQLGYSASMIKERVKAIESSVREESQQAFKELLENTEAFAKDLWAKMDQDDDGNVTFTEFTQRFLISANDIVSFSMYAPVAAGHQVDPTIEEGGAG